jgi:NADPH:quinone reductase-like Zn-dependent oxidoreductase
MTLVAKALLFVAAALPLAAAAAPPRMQAIVRSGDTLELRTVDTPRPGPGQVLVKVYAAGVNPVDWKRPTEIPGGDVGGVIDSVGEGVTAFKPGDAVIAFARTAGYAEYTLAPADFVVAKPASFTFEQAAGVPVAGVAAYRAVTDAKVQRGQRVAIIGAAGGAGSSAVQVARALGAHVIASGHSSQQAYLEKLGVNEFVAFDRDDVAAKIRNVDAALNLVDGQAPAALGYVKRGGHLSSIAGPPGEGRCEAAGVTCVVIAPGYGGVSEGEALAALASLAEKGQYTVNVSRTFPLAQAQAALDFLRNGNAVGKVVLVVDPKSAQR